MLSKAQIVLACSTLCLFVPGPSAYASNWESKGVASFGANYSDNPTLRTDDTNPQSASGTRGNLRLSFTRAEDNRATEIETRVTRNWFPDRDLKDAEQTNFYLDGNTSIRFARSNWNLSGAASEQGILTSEQTDSADFLQVDDTRRQYRISPTGTWQVNLTDFVGVNMSYTNVDFEKKINSRSDFVAKSASVFYQKSITERHSVSATYGVSNYQSERLSPGIIIISLDPLVTAPDFDNLLKSENDTDGQSISLGYVYKLSENTELNLSYGTQSSDLTSKLKREDGSLFQPELTSTFESDTYSVSIANSTESGSWSLKGAQSITPSSTGTPSESQTYSLNIDQRLTNTLRWDIKITATRRKQTGEIQDAIQGKRDFLSASTSLGWTIARGMSLTTTYTLKRRKGNSTALNEDGDFERTSSDAISNTFNFGMSYAFDI